MQTKTRKGSEVRQRQRRITFRVSDSEHAEVTQAAERTGVTLGTHVRSCVLTAPTTRARRRPSVEVQAVTRLQGEMNKIGINIHQITRRVNFGDTPTGDEIRAAFTGYREVIAAILATLNRVPR